MYVLWRCIQPHSKSVSFLPLHHFWHITSTSHQHHLHPPFIHPVALFPRRPIQWASQASLQLALQADLCHNKTTRTLSPLPTRTQIHTLKQIHKDTRTYYYKCSRNASRSMKEAMLEYKMTALFFFQLRVKLKSSPCSSLSPPFCACLTLLVLEVSP